jgi:hypothetical protein
MTSAGICTMTNRNKVLKYTFIAFATMASLGLTDAHASQGKLAPVNASQSAQVTPNASAVINVQPSAPQPLPAGPQAADSNDSGTTQSTSDELQGLIQQHDLTEMRTSYDGSYGASLLFNVHTGVYYVALFQQKAFWRVIKTADQVRAEAIYADFSRQAYTLAAGELQSARLQSQKEQMDQQISSTQDRAAQLQADLQIARQQQAAVADHQRSTHAEASALKTQTAALQAQLRALQDQVYALQRQANTGLPTSK